MVSSVYGHRWWSQNRVSEQMKHFVFAYDFAEAQEHARESGLDHGQWVFADARNKLEGVHPANIITHQVDGWESNDGCRWAWDFYRQRCQMYGVGGVESE